MGKRQSKTVPVVGPVTRLAENRALALNWLHEFEKSDVVGGLSESVRLELDFAVRVFADSWSRTGATPHPLRRMTADDVIDVLLEQLPRTVSATNPNAVVDGLVSFLVWAAKTDRLDDRSVEYACRRIHRDALAAMTDERRWSAGKAIVMHAMQDGVGLSDVAGLRQHAIGSGLDAAFVDEFLPPPPVSLGDGRFLFLGDEFKE